MLVQSQPQPVTFHFRTGESSPNDPPPKAATANAPRVPLSERMMRRPELVPIKIRNVLWLPSDQVNVARAQKKVGSHLPYMDLARSRACVAEMLEAGVPVGAHVTTLLIRACVREQELDEALDIVRTMRAPECAGQWEKPDVMTYVVLIQALVRAGRMTDALSMLQDGVHSGVFHSNLGYCEIRKSRNDDRLLDFHYGSLCQGKLHKDMHRTCPPQEVTRAIFEYHLRQKAQGYKGIDSHTRFVVGQGAPGVTKEVVRQLMIDQGWQPEELAGNPGCLVSAGARELPTDADGCIALISELSAAGNIDDVIRAFEQMKMQMEPGAPVYTEVILACIKAGRLDDAQQYSGELKRLIRFGGNLAVPAALPSR